MTDAEMILAVCLLKAGNCNLDDATAIEQIARLGIALRERRKLGLYPYEPATSRPVSEPSVERAA